MIRPRAKKATVGDVRLRGFLVAPVLIASLYLFVEYVRPQERYALFGGIPLGMVALVTLVIGGTLVGRPQRLASPVSVAVGAFLAWGAVCAFAAQSVVLGFERYVDTLKVVGYYWPLVMLIGTRRNLYYLVLFILGIYLLHTNFAFRGLAASGFSGALGGAYIGSGFLQNPNDYGAWLSAFWGVSLVLIWSDNTRLWGKLPMKWLHAAGTLLFLFSALASSSRGTALAIGVVGVCLAWYYAPNWRTRIGGFLAAVSIAFAFYSLQTPEQQKRWEVLGTQEDGSAQDRLNTWPTALRVAAANPLTGTGIGGYLDQAKRYSTQKFIFVQHNITLQALTELGVPGLLLFLGVLGAFIVQQRHVTRIAAERGDQLLGGLAKGVSISMLTFVINGQFITVLFYPFMWLLLALSTMMYGIVRSSAVSQGAS